MSDDLNRLKFTSSNKNKTKNNKKKWTTTQRDLVEKYMLKIHDKHDIRYII